MSASEEAAAMLNSEPVLPAIATLLSRSSISRLQEPAPDGRELELILEAAMRAPDHGRLRPWRFLLIRGAMRHAFAEAVEAAMRRRQPAVTEELIERQRARLTGTPLTIALAARIRPEHSIPEIEQLLSVGAAVMNMLNAIHALGFGAIWITGPNCYDPHVAASLGLIAPDRLTGFLFVGTPVEQGRAPRRPDIGDHVVEWGVDAAIGNVQADAS